MPAPFLALVLLLGSNPGAHADVGLYPKRCQPKPGITLGDINRRNVAGRYYVNRDYFLIASGLEVNRQLIHLELKIPAPDSGDSEVLTDDEKCAIQKYRDQLLDHTDTIEADVNPRLLNEETAFRSPAAKARLKALFLPARNSETPESQLRQYLRELGAADASNLSFSPGIIKFTLCEAKSFNQEPWKALRSACYLYRLEGSRNGKVLSSLSLNRDTFASRAAVETLRGQPLQPSRDILALASRELFAERY